MRRFEAEVLRRLRHRRGRLAPLGAPHELNPIRKMPRHASDGVQMAQPGFEYFYQEKGKTT